MRIRGIGMAATLAAAVVLATAPAVSLGAAPIATSRVITAHAVSLDCISHAVVGCVNVAMDLTWNETTQTGRLCIDVNDYRTPAPVPSYGCTELEPGSIRHLPKRAIAVVPQRVTTTASDDCYRADPDEGCVPRTFTMVAGITVTPRGHGATEVDWEHTVGCPAPIRGRTTVYAADVRMQVDAFGYRLPSAAPIGPRNEATLVIAEVRTRSRC